MNKKIIIIVLFLIFLLLLSNDVFDQQDIDDYSYVVAIGIDKGEKEALKISFQISIPLQNASGSESSSSSDSPDTVITTVEAPTISSGISLANSYISKELNLTHCKILAISEELSKEGINDYIYTLINNIELRPNCNIIICKTSCEEFLANSKPDLESITAKYYQIVTTSSKYTAYTSYISIIDVFFDINDTFSEPCAILGSISGSDKGSEESQSNENSESNQSSQSGQSSQNSQNSENSGESSSEDSGSGEKIAGEANIKSTVGNEESQNLEIIGLAVFKGDKFVGELNGEETICYMLLTNQLDECVISIKDPDDENNVIDLLVKMQKNTDNSVKIEDNIPHISTSVHLSANILSMTKNKDYLNEENLKDIENSANIYVKDLLNKYFEKTSKEYNSDISGFGKYAVKQFLTWDDWINYNWLDNYKNSIFDINVSTEVHSSYLLLKS